MLTIGRLPSAGTLPNPGIAGLYLGFSWIGKTIVFQIYEMLETQLN
jgi:hypothetical protein